MSCCHCHLRLCWEDSLWLSHPFRVYGLAEVYGILELLSEDILARVSWHLEQEEAGVGLWKEVIWRVVLVKDLQDKVPAYEVCNGPWQPGLAPHKNGGTDQNHVTRGSLDSIPL